MHVQQTPKPGGEKKKGKLLNGGVLALSSGSVRLHLLGWLVPLLQPFE